MPINRALFTSASEHWATPRDLYRALDKEFHFTLDPCPLGGGKLDGLAISWRKHRVFCNPPYGRGIAAWLAKATEPDLAAFLVPSRTDTHWWHDYAMTATEIRFLRGRLRFGNAVNTAPFPSVVLVWHRPKSITRGQSHSQSRG